MYVTASLKAAAAAAAAAAQSAINTVDVSYLT